MGVAPTSKVVRIRGVKACKCAYQKTGHLNKWEPGKYIQHIKYSPIFMTDFLKEKDNGLCIFLEALLIYRKNSVFINDDRWCFGNMDCLLMETVICTS